MRAKLFEKPDGGTIVLMDDNRPRRPSAADLDGLLRYTARPQEGYVDFNSLQSYFGRKAATDDSIARQITKGECEDEINWLENAAHQHQHPQLFRAAASLAESFSTWFCHTSLGEDKKPPLERTLRLLSCQAALKPQDATPLLRAASIRQGRQQVRDYAEARRLLERARDCATLTSDQRIEIDQALQRLNQPEKKPIRKATPASPVPPKFDYSQYFFVPDERTRCRALCREAKKVKNMAAMRATLEHLYRVAVIAECSHFVSHKFMDEAYYQGHEHLGANTARLLELGYQTHGRIKPFSRDKPFLSDNDYKFFELAWGPVTAKLTPAAAMGLEELLKTVRG